MRAASWLSVDVDDGEMQVEVVGVCVNRRATECSEGANRAMRPLVLSKQLRHGHQRHTAGPFSSVTRESFRNPQRSEVASFVHESIERVDAVQIPSIADCSKPGEASAVSYPHSSQHTRSKGLRPAKQLFVP